VDVDQTYVNDVKVDQTPSRLYVQPAGGRVDNRYVPPVHGCLRTLGKGRGRGVRKEACKLAACRRKVRIVDDGSTSNGVRYRSTYRKVLGL